MRGLGRRRRGTGRGRGRRRRGREGKKLTLVPRLFQSLI